MPTAKHKLPSMSSDNEIEIFDEEAIEERDSDIEEGEPDEVSDEQDLAATATVDEFLLAESESDTDSTFCPDQESESADEKLASEQEEDDMQEVLAVLGQDGADAILDFAEGSSEEEGEAEDELDSNEDSA